MYSGIVLDGSLAGKKIEYKDRYYSTNHVKMTPVYELFKTPGESTAEIKSETYIHDELFIGSSGKSVCIWTCREPKWQSHEKEVYYMERLVLLGLENKFNYEEVIKMLTSSLILLQQQGEGFDITQEGYARKVISEIEEFRDKLIDEVQSKLQDGVIIHGHKG